MHPKAKLWFIITIIVFSLSAGGSIWYFKPSTTADWTVFGVAAAVVIAINALIYRHTDFSK